MRAALSILTLVALTSPAAAANIIAAYTFNGNANDISGNGYHGTVTGANLTVDRDGNVSSAYAFDGNDQIDILGGGSVFDLTTFTVTAWARVDGSGTQAVVTYGESFDTDIMNWGMFGNRGAGVNAWIEAPNDDDYNATGPSVVGTGWHHLAITRDAAGLLSVYVDGVLGDSLASADPGLINHQVSIGYRTNSGNTKQDFLTGAIDEVSIWDDALDAGEINALMNDTVANAVSPVPEPGAIMLLSAGLLSVASFRRIRGDRRTAQRTAESSTRFPW